MPIHLLCEVRSIFRRSLVLAFVPLRDSCPREEFESQLLEPVFDDVHHIGADVPNDVEQVEEGQWTRTVDSRRFAGVRVFETAVVVAVFALRDALISIASIWGILPSCAAEAFVPLKPMVLGQPPKQHKYAAATS